VATALDAIERAHVTANDVLVEVGSAMERTALLTHLLTGVGCIGLEIQPTTVRSSCAAPSRPTATLRADHFRDFAYFP
jgi:hypothetical protein